MESMDIDRVYDKFPWPMRPDDPRAVERFKDMIELFRELIARHRYLSTINSLDEVRVLDIVAGTGIAGATLAHVLHGRGKRVCLTVTDIRESDLDKNVKAETYVCDAGSLDKCLRDRTGYYDIALLWGYSAPHFSPWDLVRVYASTAKLLKREGVLLLEETDRLYTVLTLVGYKDFLVEADYGAEKLVSIHLDYDTYRGIYKRGYYLVPGFREVGVMSVKMWDLASIAAYGWCFFREVDIVSGLTFTAKRRRKGYIILLKEPRKTSLEEDYSNLPGFLQS